MARFNYSEADNYGAQKSSYLSLKDDGDTVKVRFLLNDINDLLGVAVHEVTTNDDKKMDVECLRAYNESVDKCPLCAAGIKVLPKLFIPVYDMNSNESKIWTRGKTFFSRMSNLCSRFNPLVATPVEITRCGKKGDTSTTYEMYPDSSATDNSKVEDFPEINAEGTCFQTKTLEELQNFIQTGNFENITPRGNANRQPQRNTQNNIPTRRTPPVYTNDEESF